GAEPRRFANRAFGEGLFPRTFQWRRRSAAHHEGHHRAGRESVAADARLRPAQGPLANPHLRADARGRDGGVRQKLAKGVKIFPWAARAWVQPDNLSSGFFWGGASGIRAW